jgi:hypothetical protein
MSSRWIVGSGPCLSAVSGVERATCEGGASRLQFPPGERPKGGKTGEIPRGLEQRFDSTRVCINVGEKGGGNIGGGVKYVSHCLP